MLKTLGVAGLFLAVAGSAGAQGTPSGALATNTGATTPTGASFTAPQTWTMANLSGEIVLTAPEGDARIAIVEVPGAADAKAAAAEAWRRFEPTAAWPLKLVTARPARQGWDERAVLDYETSPNEHRDVEVVAQRKGPLWVVAIVEGSEATLEKRGAATDLTVSSLRPKGYARESFAGRTAHPLDAAAVAALLDFVTASIQELGVPGAGVALIDHGRSSSRAASACASWAARRRSTPHTLLHDRLQHQGHVHPAAGQAGRPGQARLGRAGDRRSIRRSGWAATRRPARC